MKIELERAAFSETLKMLAAVVPARPQNPTLQNILIRHAANQSVSFLTTDLEVSLHCNLIDPVSKAFGEILINAKHLSGLVSGGWSETVSIEIKKDRLLLTTGSGHFVLPAATPDDLPLFTTPEENDSITVEGESLAAAISMVLFAISKDDSRYALNGINMEIEKDQIHLVATDTHRISIVTVTGKRSKKTKQKGIVIPKGMKMLAMLAEAGESVNLSVNKNMLTANTASKTLTSSLVDGHFPNYKNILPDTINTKVTVGREVMLKALRQNSHLTESDSRTMLFVVGRDNDAIELIVDNVGNGNGNIVVEALIEGDKVTARFNAKYVIDVLAVLTGDEVTFQFKNGTSVLRIDEGDFTHGIMPQRESEEETPSAKPDPQPNENGVYENADIETFSLGRGKMAEAEVHLVFIPSVGHRWATVWNLYSNGGGMAVSVNSPVAAGRVEAILAGLIEIRDSITQAFTGTADSAKKVTPAIKKLDSYINTYS